MRLILGAFKDALFVHATGMISREAFWVDDRDESFYMIGSMGLNSAIGLGLAVNLPERTIVVIDGDGSVLMNMGTLASVGDLGPGNFVHIVLDNESYASTGGQRSVSSAVSLEQISLAAGYKYARRVEREAELAAELDALTAGARPAFMLVKVEPGNEHNTPRVAPAPADITQRFMRAIERCR